jgi:hypothetical protein
MAAMAMPAGGSVDQHLRVALCLPPPLTPPISAPISSTIGTITQTLGKMAMLLNKL